MNNSTFDLLMMILFGVLGYLIKKFGYESAPLILAVVLGPMLEQNLRQSLLLSRGSFLIFITRPISGVILGVAFLLLFTNIFTNVRKKYRQKYKELEE